MHDQNPAESIGSIVRGLLEDVSTLFRSEIALAKIEIRQTIAGVGGVAVLFATALLFALVAMAFLFVTAVLLLALVMPAWAATLLVACLLLALAALAGFLGWKRLQKTEFAPTGAIRGLREDVTMIRSELGRVRERDDE